MCMNPEEITIQQLFFDYPIHSIFSNISFSIVQGEFIAIIGPNGGGKTTLLKLLMGFLQPKKGKISIRGKPPNPWKQSIAYVPQSWRIDRQFPLSVMELVLMGRLSRLPWYGNFPQADREKALAALDQVGMRPYAKAPLEELSGGQIQRALFARALASEPDILFLDEPTANIDVEAERDIYSLLKKLKGKMTILMVTHDLHAAIHHVDRVFCVQNGISFLSPEEVCQHYGIGLYHNPLIGEE